jgi:hypothetical protein
MYNMNRKPTILVLKLEVIAKAIILMIHFENQILLLCYYEFISIITAKTNK